MKNRTVGLLLAGLACIPLLVLHAIGNGLLLDSDTNFLIAKLNEHHNPWRWFTHDWPLENHFYRPISTLIFELDNRLHPGNGSAFGLTNAILCAFSTLALYWFLTEIKRSIPIAVAGTWLFVFWTLDGWFFGYWLSSVINWIPWLCLLAIAVGMIRNKRFSWSSLGVALGGFYVWSNLTTIQPKLSNQTMFWLPGRTATSMTIFVLIALASYVRFERLGASNKPSPEPSPLDPPATRTTVAETEPRNVWGWFALSCLSTAIALGAYEQAVMIPTLIFILGIWLRLNGKQTRFAFQIFFWAILVGYLIYRVQIIPVQPSGYQKQQFRNGPGLWIDILNYVMPGLYGVYATLIGLSSDLFAMLTSSFWGPIAGFVCNVSAWVSIRKKILKPAAALALALFAYLPMAFLKQFGHYHYLPAAMMTLFVISLFEVYWPALVSAMSPQAIQAPPRSDRAPGSLPHL